MSSPAEASAAATTDAASAATCEGAIAIVANPTSGAGRGGRNGEHLLDALARRDIEARLLKTRGPSDATRLAAQAVREGAVGVVAVGGDGTLAEVAEGVLDGKGLLEPAAVDRARRAAAGEPTDVPVIPDDMPDFAILPSGTGNDLARALGTPADPEIVADRIAGGDRRRLDVTLLIVPGGPPRVFLNNLAIGYGGLSCVWVERLRSVVPGSLIYTAGGLFALALLRPRAATISFDGGPEETVRNVFECHIANGPFCGRGVTFAPSADPTDGQLDAWVIDGQPSMLGLLAYVGNTERWQGELSSGERSLDGEEFPAPGGARRVLIRRARRVVFRSESPVVFHRDGEVGHAAPGVSIETLVLPGCLPLLS